MKNSPAKPPRHLTREARGLWLRLSTEYAIIDSGGLALLEQACESLDRLRAVQAEIQRDGQQVADRFGQMRVHPLLSAERDSRSAYMRAIRQLNLDIEPQNPGLNGHGER